MENPGSSPGPTPSPVPLVRQAHGGSLRRGGHNPNSGRPPNKIKAKCRKEFEALLPTLRSIAKGELKAAQRLKELNPAADFEEVTTRDRLKAIELFGKFGMDTNVSIADVRAMLMATRTELQEVLPKDQFEMLWARIMSHWVKL